MYTDGLSTCLAVWGCQIPWNRNYSQLWADTWVLGIERESCGRAASALNQSYPSLYPWEEFVIELSHTFFFFFNLQPSPSTLEICENFRTHDTHDSYGTCSLLNSTNRRKQVITSRFCGMFSCFETRAYRWQITMQHRLSTAGIIHIYNPRLASFFFF